MDQNRRYSLGTTAIDQKRQTCPSRNADLNTSTLQAETTREPRTGFSAARRIAVVMLVALSYLVLHDFLPGGAKQWLDWFMGKDMPFKPAWIPLLVVVLLFTVIFLVAGYRYPTEKALQVRAELLWVGLGTLAAIGLLTLLTVSQWDEPHRPEGTSRTHDAKELRRPLEEGADVNTKDEYGMTALMWAAYHGQADVVRLLLDKGADATVTDQTGLTALDIASAKGHRRVVELLKAHGAKK